MCWCEKTIQAAARNRNATVSFLAGGVGRERASAGERMQRRMCDADRSVSLFYPPPALCTDNGAMIALAAAMRLQRGTASISRDYAFDVLPRWPLIAA